MRVFNISLHRTATTSMWTALDRLGFRSWHFHVDIFAPYVQGRLEHYGLLRAPGDLAFSDIPITFMYRKLYKLFPDAKFILVIRPVDSWVKSVREHMKRWGHSHVAIHTQLYGYPVTGDDFDEEVVRRTYERHHADVADFFKDKPGSLLTLSSEDLTWEPICKFLQRDVPDVSFPHVNVGAGIMGE